MKRIIIWTFALITFLGVSFALQSCKTTQKVISNMTSEVNGTWVLKSLNGQAASVLFPGKTPTLNISLTTKKVSGTGGCNRYTGMFSLNEGIFSVSNIASTMMFCSDAAKEPDFLSVLRDETGLSVKGSELVLEKDGKIVAEFIRGIDSDELIGEWTLESVAGEKMNNLFPMKEKPVSLNFDIVKNQIRGNAGCNTYGASYSIEGTTLNISELITTRMTCSNIKGETVFTRLLEGNSQIQVSTNRLTLSKDGKVVLTFSKKK